MDESLIEALSRLDTWLLKVCDAEEQRALALAGDGSVSWAGVRNLVRPTMTSLIYLDPPESPDLIPPGDHPLHRLAEAFTLQPCEAEALLVVLAAYIEPRYQALYAVLHDNLQQPHPTHRLLLSILGREPERRRLLDGSLRASGRLIRSGLLRRESDSHPPLGAPLSLPDDLLAILQGDDAPPLEHAHRQRWSWGTGTEPHANDWQVIHGRGDRMSFARRLCHNDQRLLLVTLPDDRIKAAEVARTCWRAGAAAGALPVIDMGELEEGDAIRIASVLEDLAHAVGGRAWLCYPEALPLSMNHVRCPSSTWSERRQAWLDEAARHGMALDDQSAERLATRYKLDQSAIREVFQAAPDGDFDSLDGIARHMGHSRVRHSLATTTERTFDDLVLRDTTREALERLVYFVENRDRIAEQRDLQRRYQLQRGPVALFSGRSGTGKTLAAEAVASTLRRPLHTVDLARLMSKYIGETEKHVDEVLTQAERANAVLFFDEADVLFSNRMEKSSNASERFANMMVGYLLQRIERHDGLVILATNLQNAIDEAFLRRFQFRIEFPLPEPEERQRIWELMLPATIDRSDDLDLGAIAQSYRLAGGEIRNAALKSIFLNERSGKPLEQAQLKHAVALELLELGRVSRRDAPDSGIPPDRGQLLRACVEHLQTSIEDYLRPRFLKEIHILNGSPTNELLAGKRPAVSVALFRLASRRGNHGLRAGFMISVWSHRAEEEYELLGVVHEAISGAALSSLLGQPAQMRVQESNDFDLLHRFWSSHEHPVRASLVLDVEIG